jgi:3-oxoacyl-(acyl-carrier-protein) synthase
MGKLIFIAGYRSARLSFAAEKETLPRLAKLVAEFFQPLANSDEAGLYLVSANAGFQSSLQFWSDARRSGLNVASPELFPWTLANAASSWLAREFQITGPNFTYMGQTEALLDALGQARDHLRAGLVATAWVVALDFAQAQGECTNFAGLRLSTQPSSLGVEINPSPALVGKGQSNASSYLSRICRRLEKGKQ